MADTVIYEFTAYAEGVEEWATTPGNMVDGVTTNYAVTGDDGDIQKLTGNECVGTDLGTISKVEIAAYAYGDVDDQLILRPVFGGTDDGDNHTFVPGVTAGWKAWQDITEDTNSPTVTKQSLATGENTQVESYGGRWNAQTFTPAENHDVAWVSLKVYREGSPGEVTVSIRATAGGKPTGGDLAVGTTDGNTLTLDTAGEWRTVTFAPAYSLSASTLYAIVVGAVGGNSTNSVHWHGVTPSAYADGAAHLSINSGETWGAALTFDLLFKEGTPWTWPDIQNLDCDVETNDVAKGNTYYCGMVQIQVTYTAAAAEGNPWYYYAQQQ